MQTYFLADTIQRWPNPFGTKTRVCDAKGTHVGFLQIAVHNFFYFNEAHNVKQINMRMVT